MIQDHPDVDLIVIGGGLAGTDAAWLAARYGASVALYEMRPRVMTPAHKTDRLAELVCSNSLKSNLLTTAAGLLKQEMRLLGSLVISAGDRSAVPSGGALAVDRERFAQIITEAIEAEPHIHLIRDEMPSLPPEIPTIVATGPLTSEALAAEIQAITGREQLYFYDAASPIIDADSIDRSICFEASRYGKGQEEGGAGGYLNCPLTEEEYHAFREELLKAEKVPLKDFEPVKLFEGCLPIEEMAARGERTMAFGPMKPVGLTDPRTGRWPFAVVQLRQENEGATLYSMVAFQTRLTWPEQRRIFRMIPGLQNAEFVRLGVMHRNTYICSPELLEPTMRLRDEIAARVGRGAPLYFAGQMTGVEGYTESAATGIIAGINAALARRGEAPFVPPRATMIGSLCDYIARGPADNFQPMNSNLGLLPPLEVPIRKKEERHAALIHRATETMERAAAGIAPREAVGLR
jgi:methylenetetrahydrofolate--tRNA-(uracil-5-)-methyltransferase